MCGLLWCVNDHKRCVEEDREYFPCDPCLTLRRIQYLKALISFFFSPSLTIKQKPQGMATLHRITLKLTPPQRFFLFRGVPAGAKNKKNNRERDKNDSMILLMFFSAPSSNRQQWVSQAAGTPTCSQLPWQGRATRIIYCRVCEFAPTSYSQSWWWTVQNFNWI